jgi:hypothetical protein
VLPGLLASFDRGAKITLRLRRAVEAFKFMEGDRGQNGPRRLPAWIAASVPFLRKPSGRWLRIQSGLLLIFGGLLPFLRFLASGCCRSVCCFWRKTLQCCDAGALVFSIGLNGGTQDGWNQAAAPESRALWIQEIGQTSDDD